MTTGWEDVLSHQPTRSQSAARTFRLDDSTWRARESSLKRVRRALLPVFIVTGGTVGYIGGRITGTWSWWWVIWPALLGAALGGLALASLEPSPNSMTFTAGGLEFHRPNGKHFILRLTGGVKVTLLDQSRYVADHASWFGSYPPYVLAHSRSTQSVFLTLEAFQAVREELYQRGATLLRQAPAPMTPGSILYQYRL